MGQRDRELVPGDLIRGAVSWLPLFEAVAPGRRLFPVAPDASPPSLCPASAPDSLPLDTMLSVFLVLPLILFFKG